MLYTIETDQARDVRINLALEEYCLRHLEPQNAYVVFYINDPAVVIGRHQNPWQESNLFYLQRHNIPVVRRISGGGTVFHDAGNLNFCFFNPFNRNSLTSIKNRLAPLLESLQNLGIDAKLDERNSIFIGSRKISGNAQFTNTRRIMVHGTLLFDTELESLKKALKPTFDTISSSSPASIRQPVTNIAGHMQMPMDIHEFERNLLETIAHKSGGLERYRLKAFQWDQIRHLARHKYGSWKWNFGKTPDCRVSKVGSIGDKPVNVAVHIKSGLIDAIELHPEGTLSSEMVIGLQRLGGVRYDRRAIAEALAPYGAAMAAQSVHRRQLADLIF